MKKLSILPLIFVIFIYPVWAEITLPAIFTDNMVLQQQSEVTIWGWANPIENVNVGVSWDTAVARTKADNYARWMVKIKTPVAGGPYTVTIAGGDTIVLKNVMIGEVWLCSGQSNMEMSAAWGIDNAQEEINNANFPDIRLFQVTKQAAMNKQIDLKGSWAVCTPASMKNFSAAGYFFGRKLNKELNIPIGLINSSWGGTAAETWINPEIIANNHQLSEAAKKISDTAPWCPGKPGSTYNSMIYPILHFKIAGVIWYQGEANTANAESYADIFSTLIKDWRKEFNKDLPFYYVQIAPYKYGRPFEGAMVREAQLKCMSVPNTGMVVISDIGNLNDIHPKDKQDVGLRLANWALANTYGKTGVTFSGPVYREMKVNKNKVTLYFDYAEHGLMAKDGPLTSFQVAGADKVFVDAKAKIDGSTVIVSAKNVREPVAVRFAFSNMADPNLFNVEGLPASSFRTDDWAVSMEKK